MEPPPNPLEREAPRASVTWAPLPFQPHDAGRAQWETAGRQRRVIIITKIPRAQTCEQAERRICRILAKHEIASPVFYCSQNRTIGEHHKHQHDGWLYAAFQDRQTANHAIVRLHRTSLPNGERLCASKVMPPREDTTGPASLTSAVLSAATETLATMGRSTATASSYGYSIPGAFGSRVTSWELGQPVLQAPPPSLSGEEASQEHDDVNSADGNGVLRDVAKRARSLGEIQADYDAICEATFF